MCYFCHTLGNNINAPDHRSRNCRDTRNIHSKQYIPPTKPNVNFAAKCGALGCSENHYRHYCKFCRNPDSNHMSAFCPSKLAP